MQLDLGKLSFGVQRKIVLHHPFVVTGLFFERLFDGFSFVLPKIKDLLALGIKYKTASQVYHTLID